MARVACVLTTKLDTRPSEHDQLLRVDAESCRVYAWGIIYRVADRHAIHIRLANGKQVHVG